MIELFGLKPLKERADVKVFTLLYPAENTKLPRDVGTGNTNPKLSNAVLLFVAVLELPKNVALFE